MSRPRLLLADDHALVIEGLKKLLEPEFDVVGTVEDGHSLVHHVRDLLPDVVLLDISMPLLNGLEAARQALKAAPRAKIVFVTMHSELAYVTEAMRAGGSGYILKRSAASELVTAIWTVLRGGVYITPLIPQPPDGDSISAALESDAAGSVLTTRQREVLQLVAEGKSTKEAAAVLDISIKTVEFHKTAIMRKLGIHSIAELTRYAIEHRISTT